MQNREPGPGIDADGRQIPDPSENVKALTEASVKRLDDLRDLEARHQDRVADLVAHHLQEISDLRAYFGKELRDAESKRIDAIRAVDISAVNRAAEVSVAQAQTLATQVAQSAETLRTQVQASATAAQVALSAALDPIIKDIADLRRAQYEAQGQKTQVVEGRAGMTTAMGVFTIVLTLLIVMIALAGLIVTH